MINISSQLTAISAMLYNKGASCVTIIEVKREKGFEFLGVRFYGTVERICITTAH